MFSTCFCVHEEKPFVHTLQIHESKYRSIVTSGPFSLLRVGSGHEANCLQEVVNADLKVTTTLSHKYPLHLTQTKIVQNFSSQLFPQQEV